MRVAVLFLALLLAGCHSIRPIPGPTSNYTVVKSAQTGKSEGFRLLGLIPFKQADCGEARQRLFSSANLDASSPNLVLANANQEVRAAYFILGSINSCTVTGDIVQLKEGAAK